MKIAKTHWLVLLVFFNAVSCNWCRIECDVFPGVDIAFEFLNANNNNLLELGELDADSIYFTMGNSNEQQAVYFLENRVVLSFIESEELYTLVVDDRSFALVVQIKEDDDGDCCASYSLKKLSVDGVEVTPIDGLVTIHI